LPLSFRSEKFWQKSGASLFEIPSNRKVINIRCDDKTGVIKVSGEYEVDAEQVLMKAISDGYWKIDGKIFNLKQNIR